MSYLTEDDFDYIGHYNMVDDDFLELLFKKQYEQDETTWCPKCYKISVFKRVKNRKAFHCTNCGFQIYPMKGTVFEKTTRLDWWATFVNVLLWRPNETITELRQCAYYGDGKSEEYCVSYKTALRMKHIIKKQIIGNRFFICPIKSKNK